MSTTAAPVTLLPAPVAHTAPGGWTSPASAYVNARATGETLATVHGATLDQARERAAQIARALNGSATLPETLRRAVEALTIAADLYRWRAEVEAPAKGFDPSIELANLASAETALAAVRGELAKLTGESETRENPLTRAASLC